MSTNEGTRFDRVALPTVGIIGLGIMGKGIASNLLAAGFPVVVCDLRPEATEPFAPNATIASSPAEVSRQSDVIVVAVVDDPQVYSVLSGPTGALAAADSDTTFIVVSTVTTECVARIGAEAAARGVPIVDCGVSGGPSAAASGNLVCMCGGDPEVIATLDPVFSAIGSLTVTMGPFGKGLIAKLARNLIQYGAWLAAYEGQVLAEAAGIELAQLAQIVRAADAQSGGTTSLMFRSTATPFTERDDPGLVGAMRSGSTLAHKDLRAAMNLARELGVKLPLAEMADDRCDAIFGVGDLPPAAVMPAQ
jgi:3-hydroxyisobutyrate dehydrogenase-like beta-hydroxyacid dehydrogenase